MKSTNQPYIVLDGFVGGAKSAVANVVSSLKDIEHWRVNSSIESACNLYRNNLISETAASEIITAAISEHRRDLPLARNTNFNFHDQSSAWNDPQRRYFLRLFRSPKIFSLKYPSNISGQPLLMTHSTADCCPIFAKSLADDLRYIWVVRSPNSIPMLLQVMRWIQTWESGKGAQRFYSKTPLSTFNIPVLLPELVSLYPDENTLGKAILLLSSWISRGYHSYSHPSFHDVKKLIIPIENFLVDTQKYLSSICVLLDTSHTSHTKRSLIKENLPRPTPSGYHRHRDYLYARQETKDSITSSRDTVDGLSISRNAYSILCEYLDVYQTIVDAQQ